MSASGGATDDKNPLWPGPVIIDNDNKKSIRMLLTVKEMEVITSLFAPNKPKNTIVKPDIRAEEVIMQFEVTTKSGDVKTYEYKKLLPADIIPEKTAVKFKKNGFVELTLWKAKEALWSPHAQHMSSRNKE